MLPFLVRILILTRTIITLNYDGLKTIRRGGTALLTLAVRLRFACQPLPFRRSNT